MQSLRILLLGAAVAVTLGSSTSNQQAQPTGYYPQQGQPPQQQPPQAEPSAPPPAVAAAPEGTCQAFCNHVVDCKLETFDSCMRQCHDANLENKDGGPAFLTEVTRASCERIADMAKEPAAPPPPQPQQPPPPAQPEQGGEQKRTQWVCNAQGMWQRCETQGYQCYPQTTFMLGFGPTEPLARSNAESVCNGSMQKLMSANFAYRTSVTSPCRTIKCTPPNAK